MLNKNTYKIIYINGKQTKGSQTFVMKNIKKDYVKKIIKIINKDEFTLYPISNEKNINKFIQFYDSFDIDIIELFNL